jgi:hypothetical protein
MRCQVTVISSLVGLVLLRLAAGGGEASEGSDQGNRFRSADGRPIITNTAGLGLWLRAGMHTNEVVAVLGEPTSCFHWSKEVVAWDYSLPPFIDGEGRWRRFIPGFTVKVTNGHVRSFDFIYLHFDGSK